MKRLTGISRLVAMIGALTVMVVIAVIIWYHRADPLNDNGLTVYTDPVGNFKVYTIEVVNRSESDIDIQSVTVNSEKMPNRVQLGITYNSGRLVQFLGDQTDPATKLMDLHDASIQSQLSDQEIRTILASKVNSNKQTPIHYGVVVRYDEEPLQEVTIRYTYLGFTKVKRVTKWFDFGETP
ncbi:hypothetical protein QFZ77_004541 [Paenibacillus sp. V4I3]|uniref:hypothetical protein n=1 Tax=unclassified Paenibacillus TaxID=185978 RepID=UPI002788AEE8|nr:MULTISPECIES: hypothetical protein [unclassified Paenibacillus]MDQ0875882.1 hypothetical protein [Paenibacillus sp. V4I3]MDQ0888055.1 hypothetical protein [Paenibacillus sp. V4I9]